MIAVYGQANNIIFKQLYLALNGRTACLLQQLHLVLLVTFASIANQFTVLTCLAISNIRIDWFRAGKQVHWLQPWARYLEGDNISTKIGLGRVEIEIWEASPIL